MKILQLVSSLGIGGAEKFVTDLSIEQKKLGNDVVIIVLDNAKDISKDEKYEKTLLDILKNNKIQVYFMGDNARKKPHKLFLKLKSIIINEKPDIIHSHLIWWSIFLSFLKFNYKHVFTQHTNQLTRKPLHKYFLQNYIDCYIAICDEAFHSMSIQIYNSKIYKIINGVRIKDFPFYKRKVNAVKNIVTISRITDEKNHFMILDALINIRKKHSNTPFNWNIVGDGPLFNELKDKVHKSCISNDVIFLGTCSNISQILSENDLYLLPSKCEGFSIALIEALASGIRIIASDVGGNAETLKDGKLGLLISKNDIIELTSAIESVLFNDMRLNTRSEVEAQLENLSIEVCAKNHINLYQDLIHEKNV